MTWLSTELSVSFVPHYIFYKAQKMVADLKSADPGVLEAVVNELTQVFKKPASVDNISMRSPKGSVDSRSATSSESSSRARAESLSSVNTSVVERELNVDIHRMLRDEERDITKLVNLRTEDLTRLYDKVYESLQGELKKQGSFPDDLHLEGVKFGYVRALIDAIRDYICEDFELDDSRLRRQEQERFQIRLQGKRRNVKADFVIFQDDPKKLYCAVVEVEKENCAYGIKQGLAYLRAAADANADNEKLYGFCTTATHFNVILFEPNVGYRLHEPLRLMYGRMFNPGEKARWIEDCHLIIKVMYSILCEKLRLPQKPQQ